MIPIDCFISGHYYKLDTESSNHPSEVGITYYVKCVRCGDRRLINDKTYYDRKEGKYKL